MNRGRTLPLGGLNMTSSPTSKGLEDRMMSPVNRFSMISRPARPTARPPTPPMASTEFTAEAARHAFSEVLVHGSERQDSCWLHASGSKEM